MMHTEHDLTFPLVIMGVFIAYIIGLVIWNRTRYRKERKRKSC